MPTTTWCGGGLFRRSSEVGSPRDGLLRESSHNVARGTDVTSKSIICGMSLPGQLRIALTIRVGFWSLLLGIPVSGYAAQKNAAALPPPPEPTAVTSSWSKAVVPFKAIRITAVGDVFWVCGDNEMIASSSDGGSTWSVQHQDPDGATLLDIQFVTREVGHAAGTKGRLLSTVDGGKTWEVHNATDSVWAFSFSDAHNGIAVIGGDGDLGPGRSTQPLPMDGAVKLTHDGGDHWEDIPALSGDELRPYTMTLAIAALDTSNYLMIRRQPAIEDVFLVTHDAGRSWHAVHQRDDTTNREFARWVFVHGGEYWAFGLELVHRDTRGGYSVPLTLHSKNGDAWVHGTSGPKEFGNCNPQGCYMWDGAVESLFGEHEQYFALPQDGTMTGAWALTQNRACTIGEFLECGPATITEQPQARSNRATGSPQPVQAGTTRTPSPAFRVGLPEGCVQCNLDPIPWKLQQRSVLWVVAKLQVGPGGEVKDVALSQQLGLLGPSISQQLSHWRFNSSPDGSEATKDVRLVVRCGFDNAACEIVPTIAEQ